MVDRDLVLRKISELDEYQQQLQEFKGITVQQYRRVADRWISECAVSYADIFKVLGENNVLEKKLVDRMEKMAKFRNILVHQYEKIEAEIIVGILKNNLRDFDQFRKAVVGFVQNPQNLK